MGERPVLMQLLRRAPRRLSGVEKAVYGHLMDRLLAEYGSFPVFVRLAKLRDHGFTFWWLYVFPEPPESGAAYTNDYRDICCLALEGERITATSGAAVPNYDTHADLPLAQPDALEQVLELAGAALYEYFERRGELDRYC